MGEKLQPYISDKGLISRTQKDPYSPTTERHQIYK